MECVPNFSEGRDLQKIDKIVAPFRGKQGVKLLDYSNDEDHNRLVVTVVGEPEPLRDAVLEAIGVALYGQQPNSPDEGQKQTFHIRRREDYNVLQPPCPLLSRGQRLLPSSHSGWG